MSQPRSRHLLCAALLGVVLPGSASAVTPDRLLNESIPASSCQPVSPEDRDAAQLTETGWTFGDEMSGTIELECPILTPYRYTQEPERVIPEYWLWYLDQDGDGMLGNVRSELCSRSLNAALSHCHPRLDSRTSTDTGYTSVTQTFTSPGLTMTDSQYFAKVTLTYSGRDGAGQVVFKGLSFTEEPP